MKRKNNLIFVLVLLLFGCHKLKTSDKISSTNCTISINKIIYYVPKEIVNSSVKKYVSFEISIKNTALDTLWLLDKNNSKVRLSFTIENGSNDKYSLVEPKFENSSFILKNDSSTFFLGLEENFAIQIATNDDSKNISFLKSIASDFNFNCKYVEDEQTKKIKVERRSSPIEIEINRNWEPKSVGVK